MKRTLILLLLLCIGTLAFAQKKKGGKNPFTKETFLKQSAESACDCIDTIYTGDKDKEAMAVSIHDCIKVSTAVYQISASLIDAKIMDTIESGRDTNMKININIDPNSDDFKKSYYELEAYVMDNCASAKKNMMVNDKTNKNSFSDNEEAMEWYRKGIAANEKNNEKKSIEYYKKAIKADSNFAFAWDNLGLSYRKLEDYDNAIFAYKKSLQVDPRGLTPLQNLAVAYQYKKEYEKAIATYERIAKLEPENPEIYYGIGLVHTTYLKQYEDGLINLCKAFNLYTKLKSPYRADAQKMIQYIYLEMKNEGKESRFKEILKENNIDME